MAPTVNEGKVFTRIFVLIYSVAIATDARCRSVKALNINNVRCPDVTRVWKSLFDGLQTVTVKGEDKEYIRRIQPLQIFSSVS